MGSVAIFVGATAPSGWHFCDGTPHGSAALEALIGSPNTPDLRDRFIVGAGRLYPLKSTGGAATVTLTGGQSGEPAHTHGAAAPHVHSANPPSVTPPNVGIAPHNHSSPSGYSGFGLIPPAGSFAGTNADNNYQSTSAHSYLTDTTTIDHLHSVDIPAATSAVGSPIVTIGSVTAANATEAHENMPPFFALAYVIKTE